MKTIVITGGTDGIGAALAVTYRRRGDNVVIVGRDAAKGVEVLDAAGDVGGEGLVVPADLSLIGENDRVVKEIKAKFPTVDALVLCARYFNSRRTVTADGFEHTFALFYLSRFLLGHGLADTLAETSSPVIMNVAGPGPNPVEIQWDDLELTRGYQGVNALMQGGRLNDLLGVAFAERHPGSPIRYVLLHPGSTATSFAGEYDPPTAAQIESMRRFGKPVAKSIVPIVAALDDPPPEPLSAIVEGRRIGIEGGGFDRDKALRLDRITKELLSR
ncbi:SDR family NAD(P)-dependent oxidoreductase [Plantactinospora sp. CA-294935]|uniref:SDR family NAD(P)-dependent oxidoreductase n=1 Tax=Plantactinospora sp. CA-294935 TaxID=3240012 RepID=UPI003D8B7FF8